MKTTVTFEDKGSQGVVMGTDVSLDNGEGDGTVPTPALILSVAVRALFENGMLARMGQVALEGISKGVDPAIHLSNNYKEMPNNGTDP